MAVFAVAALNALTQFALQAWMSYGFARDVWHLPQTLSFAVIFALDAFAVLFMFLTYRLRRAPWWGAKGFVWLAFLAALGAQLFAAELYGAHEKWIMPVRIFAATPALFLAVSLEGINLWRSHTNHPRSSPRFLAAPHWPPMDEKRARALAAARAAAMRGPEPEKKIKPPRVPRPPRRERAGVPTDVAAIMATRGVGKRRAQQIVKAAASSQPVSPAPAGDTREITAGRVSVSDAPVP